MGTKLFGIDIARKLYGATRGKLVPLVLIKYTPTTRDTADLGGGLRPTSISYPAEGFIEDPALVSAGQGYRPRDAIVEVNRLVSIIGDSLPVGVVPFGEPMSSRNDKITILGKTYQVVRVQTDPAQALYICQVKA